MSATTQVRRAGNIIRYNLAWTLAMLGHVLLVAVRFAVFVLHVMGMQFAACGPAEQPSGGARMARRHKRRLGLFDVIMLLIVLAVAWLFLGQAGIVPPLPIGP